MQKIFSLIVLLAVILSAETLFEVKDASNNKVLDVSTDGLRIMNMGDTMMVISPSGVNVNINPSAKGLSRTFSVTTASSKGRGINALEVSSASTKMREGFAGEKYTDFSPENIFLGLNSGVGTDIDMNNGYGVHNVFLGNGSGQLNSFGSYNVFIGKNSGYSNIGSGNGPLDGRYNVFLGYASGYSNSSGGCNVFLGDEAGYFNTIGMHNIYIGTETGRDNVSGDGNTCVGSDSFVFGDGEWNTFMGYLSGMYSNGSNNVMIGNEAGFGSDGSNNVFLGNRAGYQQNVSHRLYIDNINNANPLIYGEFDKDSLRINGKMSVSGNSTVFGKLGIGVKPLYKIHAVDATASDDSPAVYGKHAVTDYYGIGVKGEGKYMGVFATASTSVNDCIGIQGAASGAGTGTRYGVYGTASGGTTAWAGYFQGNVEVTGTLTKSADETKTDHPLDPENKYLTHSGVSSSEMKNIYDGIVMLDSRGQATVSLPDWFEAYNGSFRYQLTAVGKACPGIFVSRKISNGSFEISGGESGAEISWQITGVRIDKFATKNPFTVESKKNADEKGLYVNPEAFGLNENRGISYKNFKKQ